MIHFRCPKCNKRLGVNESQAGKVGVCPECKGKFRVPGVWTVDEFTALARKESQPSQKDDVPPPPMRKRRRDEEDDDLPSEDDEEERKPARKRKKKRRKKGLGLLKRLDFYWASLIVLGGISLLSLALSPIWPGGGRPGDRPGLGTGRVRRALGRIHHLGRQLPNPFTLQLGALLLLLLSVNAF